MIAVTAWEVLKWVGVAALGIVIIGFAVGISTALIAGVLKAVRREKK